MVRCLIKLGLRIEHELEAIRIDRFDPGRHVSQGDGNV